MYAVTRPAVLLTLVLLVCSPVRLAYASKTFGVPDCGQWSQAQGQDVPARTWLLGFMTGINLMLDLNAPKDVTPPDFLSQASSAQQIFSWTDKYCRENPLENLARAGMKLLFELGERK